MEILIIIIFIVTSAIGNVFGVKTCIPKPANCLEKGENINVIYVDNLPPKDNCYSVTIDNRSYIYDAVNITKVLITLKNTNTNCDLNTMNQMKVKLNLTNDDVIFIEVTDIFFRIIFANQSNTNGVSFTTTYPSKFEQKLKLANYTLFYVPTDSKSIGKVCFYGGTIDQNYAGAGYKCICNTRGITVGPRCEYMERTLDSSMYFFNIFQSDSKILLTFSLYSNGIQKNQSLVTIKNSKFERVVEVVVKESVMYLFSSGPPAYVPYILDLQKWVEVSIEMTKKKVKLQINLQKLEINFTTELTENLSSNYLVLKEDDLKEFKICIRNLKANAQIIDLNNADKYNSCCDDRCKCVENQICDCSPFVSNGLTYCLCKSGFKKNGSICIQDKIINSEIKNSEVVLYNKTEWLNRVDFTFRTLSVVGTLMTVLLESQPYNISINIENAKLKLEVSDARDLVINYNVSDGKYHIVTLNILPGSLEMILDDNANYSVIVVGWTNSDNIKSYTFKFGPLPKPYNNTVNNYTTCLFSIRINGSSDLNITGIDGVLPQCSTGPRCSTSNIACGDNQHCVDNEWQNTKCICNSNFTSTNNQCVYYLCLPNPCQNGGVCAYNASSQYYQCNCATGCWGNNCESCPVVAATLWWIAILVVLLLLLIVLIVLLIYCCCYKNKSKPGAPYIKEIHENTVIYNEQAGESDYNGPPIDYNLMMGILNNKGYQPSVPINPIPNLMIQKKDIDKNNDDLILDHPLEYGYEGYNSDNESVSSLGSNSTNSQLNTVPLDNTNDRFNYLNNLYK